jgi:hypothetical protein
MMKRQIDSYSTFLNGQVQVNLRLVAYSALTIKVNAISCGCVPHLLLARQK